MTMLLSYTFKYFVQSLKESSNQKLTSEFLTEAITMFEKVPDVLLFKEPEGLKVLTESLDKSYLLMYSFIEKYVKISF